MRNKTKGLITIPTIAPAWIEDEEAGVVAVEEGAMMLI